MTRRNLAPKGEFIHWVNVHSKFEAVTRCEPPDGVRCWLHTDPSNTISLMDARRHALDHPGHLVIREAIDRTQYYLDPIDAGG